jgi:predicted DNA-binding protein
MPSTLTVRLDDDLAEALQRASRRSGVPKGAIVRQAVAAHLGAARDLTVMARYFGAIRGPGDLSTNKAYRRAWTKRRG